MALRISALRVVPTKIPSSRKLHTEMSGEKIIQGDFAPGFSIKWQAKDARIAVEAAKKLGMDLPGLELARKRLEEAAGKGMGEDGTQSIYRLYDRAG